VPKHVQKEKPSDFPRSDANQTIADAPPHEQAKAAAQEPANQNDETHGVSQDDSHESSGEYTEDKQERGVVETSTKQPGNGHTHSDEQIRTEIQQRLSKERAPRASHLLVSVGEGVVTLRGQVDDELERKRLTDIVRAVGAVRELHDELWTRATRNEIN
jgi:osmotically-inducible protein OsmY